MDLPAIAARLLRDAGEAGDVVALTRLSGGRNNRVFRLDRAGAPPLALKLYHHDPRDTRDRLGAEWAFLRFAWDAGLRDVPRPLAADPDAHSALYSFVPGTRVARVEARHVTSALRFIAALNAPTPPNLAPASEACFSMAAHSATVDRRVARLRMQIDADAPHADAARALVETRLAPMWQRISASLPHDDAPTPCCVSPSDFGFHNALADADGALTFLDFEYAGRDDPAKLVCDFFCQPEVPVPMVHYPAFRDSVAGPSAARCDALLPAYRVKWACIMLNDFLVTDAARRDFAEGQDRATRCAAQIRKAAAALDLIA